MNNETNTRPDIPMGRTYDNYGNLISYRNESGWTEHTYNNLRQELTYKNSTGFSYEYTYDTNGEELTYKDNSGYHGEYTYDTNGKELTYKDNSGYHGEYTYDTNGNKLTYKDNEGKCLVYLVTSGETELYYCCSTKDYIFSSYSLTREEALEHWGAIRKGDTKKAALIHAAILAFNPDKYNIAPDGQPYKLSERAALAYETMRAFNNKPPRLDTAKAINYIS